MDHADIRLQTRITKLMRDIDNDHKQVKQIVENAKKKEVLF